MPIIRLVYSSTAVGPMSYADLVGIMSPAHEHNRAHGITGLLCYGSGQFLQALEGDRHAVSALYHRIAGDSRHTACQLISVTDVVERDFPEWSMNVVNWDAGSSAHAKALGAAAPSSPDFDPLTMTGGQATQFLRHLAAVERDLSTDG